MTYIYLFQVKQKVVEKLVPFLTSGNEELKSLIFRLLLNLSFDVSIRQQIVDNGLLPKIASNFGLYFTTCIQFYVIVNS